MSTLYHDTVTMVTAETQQSVSAGSSTSAEPLAKSTPLPSRRPLPLFLHPCISLTNQSSGRNPGTCWPNATRNKLQRGTLKSSILLIFLANLSQPIIFMLYSLFSFYFLWWQGSRVEDIFRSARHLIGLLNTQVSNQDSRFRIKLWFIYLWLIIIIHCTCWWHILGFNFAENKEGQIQCRWKWPGEKKLSNWVITYTYFNTVELYRKKSVFYFCNN